MDAKYIKVNGCVIPGLENLAGCTDLCSVLAALGQLIVDNGGTGSALTVDLQIIDRNAPLASTVTTSAACGPLTECSWTIWNLATNQSYTFAGAPGADASNEIYVINGMYSLPLIDWNAVGGQLCNYRVALTVTDSCNRFATDIELSLLPTAPNGPPLYRQVYSYTGNDQVITVPTCATKALVKCWGGGGYSQSYLASHTAGAGGYTEAVITVTPGETLRVIVGEGGSLANVYGFAGTSNRGSGGGLSGLFRKLGLLTGISANEAHFALIIAGGGGGADYAGTAQSRGGNGNDPVYSGGQSSMQGVTDTLDGGTSSTYNAGGGGGYRGGGRHYRDSIQGQAATLPYGGEGGSGFVVAGATNVVMLASPDGQRTPPNITDTDYQLGIGVGGAGNVVDGPGGPGRVVVYWMTG